MRGKWYRMKPYTRHEIEGDGLISGFDTVILSERQYQDLRMRVIAATEGYFATKGIDLIWDDTVRLGAEASDSVKGESLGIWIDVKHVGYQVLQDWLEENGYENDEAYLQRLRKSAKGPLSSVWQQPVLL